MAWSYVTSFHGQLNYKQWTFSFITWENFSPPPRSLASGAEEMIMAERRRTDSRVLAASIAGT
jgi:hypothetical protein